MSHDLVVPERIEAAASSFRLRPGRGEALSAARAEWIALDAAHLVELPPGANIVFASGAHDVYALAEGRRLAVVTVGAEGAIAVAGGRVERARPASIAADAPGSGDVFAGTLLVELARGHELARTRWNGDAGGARLARVNLAASLLCAAERNPGAEAIVDGETRLTYAELLDRVARVAGGLELEPGRAPRRRCPLPARHGASLLGVPVARRDLRPALAARVRGRPRLLPRRLGPASSRGGRGAAGRRRRTPARSTADDEEESLMLYTSGTTGQPKGVPRSHRADRAGGLSQVVHQGYRYGDRTLGCMPLYHTMGIHSLVAMHWSAVATSAGPTGTPSAAIELIERERITSLYLAPTLYHDSSRIRSRRPRPGLRRDARLRGRGDDERPRRALRGGVRARRS